jgi:hypothetical protein
MNPGARSFAQRAKLHAQTAQRLSNFRKRQLLPEFCAKRKTPQAIAAKRQSLIA